MWLGMTQDQWLGMLRQILPVLGGVAVTLGWLTADQVGALTSIILQIAGPITIVVSVIWSAVANSKSSILQSASQMPEVKAISITDPKLAATAHAADPATDIKVVKG